MSSLLPPALDELWVAIQEWQDLYPLFEAYLIFLKNLLHSYLLVLTC